MLVMQGLRGCANATTTLAWEAWACAVEADGPTRPTRINHATAAHISKTRRVYLQRLQNHRCSPRRRASKLLAADNKRRATAVNRRFRESLRDFLVGVTIEPAALCMLHRGALSDSTGLVDRWDCSSNIVPTLPKNHSSVPFIREFRSNNKAFIHRNKGMSLK